MSRRKIRKGPRQKQPREDAVSGRAALQAEANKRRAVNKRRRIAAAHAEALAEASEGAGYRYAALTLADRKREPLFKAGFERAVKAATAEFEGQEKTPELQAEIGGAIEGAIARYNQAAIDSGELQPRDLLLLELPTARVYDDGRVESTHPRDEDMRRLAAEYDRIKDAFRLHRHSKIS